MNHYQLFIKDGANVQELDIDTVDFSTVFSVSDTSNIGGRKDNITQNVQLKGTKNNNIIFGNLYDIGRDVGGFAANMLTNYAPNKRVKCYVFENSMQIISGYLLVSSVAVSGNEILYDCLITGDVVTFMGSLDDRELTDLTSLKSFTHTYNYDTIKASWDSDKPYLYPMISYGVNHMSNDFDIRNYRPAIWLQTYFDAIFKGFDVSESGTVTQPQQSKYTWSGSIKNDAAFTKAFVPFNDVLFTKQVNDSLYSATAGYYRISASSIKRSALSVIRGSNETDTGWTGNNNDLVSYAQENYYSTPFPVFTLYDSLKTELYLDVDINITYPSGGAGRTIYIGIIKPNGTTFDETNFVASYAIQCEPDGVTDRNYKFTVKGDYGDYSGKYVLALIRSGDFSTGFTLNSGKFRVGGETASVVPVLSGDTISLHDVVPIGIKIKDFFKSVMTMYNLYMIVNPENENEFLIQSHDDFYSKALSPKQHAKEWTNKIDFENYNINSNINIPKSYNFKFKEDSDYLNEEYKRKYNDTYGNFTINDSQGLSDAKTIDVIFSPTIMYSESGNDKTLPALYKLNNNNSPEPLKTNIRLLIYNGTRDVSAYQVKNGDAVV